MPLNSAIEVAGWPMLEVPTSIQLPLHLDVYLNNLFPLQPVI